MSKRQRLDRAGVAAPQIERLEPEDWQIYNWFADLNKARQSGMNGPLPIPYTEMQAWLLLTRETVSSAQITLLRDMDEAYLIAHAKIRDEQEREREAREKALEEAKNLLR